MILEMDNVSKRYKVPKKNKSFLRNFVFPEYKEIVAVNNINLKVDKGETVGYIGLNGAGKSTTIKLLTGILTPTQGEVRLFNENISKNRNEKNKRFSAVFGQRSNLWYDLPVIDSYKYFKALYKVSDEDFQQNLNNISEILEISNLLDRPVRKLSLGQKMKCELGGALLSNPEILFLDEPTIGLDIFAKENFLNCVQRVKKKIDMTVFFTTHNMDEIDKICDRIIVLDKGEILFDGSIEKVKEIVGDYQKIALMLDNYEAIKGKDLYYDYQSENYLNGKIELNIDRNKINTADVINYYFKNCIVKDVNIDNSNLEEIIKQLYGK